MMCSTCYARHECPDAGRPCEHYRTDDSETAGRAWLRVHRCPKCTHYRQPACPYKMRKALNGWKCSGYRCDPEKTTFNETRHK